MQPCAARWLPMDNEGVECTGMLYRVPDDAGVPDALWSMNLATLYVTSAAIGMIEADLAAAPQRRGLLAREVGVRGPPTNRFAG